MFDAKTVAYTLPGKAWFVGLRTREAHTKQPARVLTVLRGEGETNGRKADRCLLL